MYIPKELIIFLLGFITFPFLCYIIFVIKDNKYEKEQIEKEKEKQEKYNEFTKRLGG